MPLVGNEPRIPAQRSVRESKAKKAVKLTKAEMQGLYKELSALLVIRERVAGPSSKKTQSVRTLMNRIAEEYGHAWDTALPVEPDSSLGTALDSGR